MSFVSPLVGTTQRVPLPDAIIRATTYRFCSQAQIFLVLP